MTVSSDMSKPEQRQYATARNSIETTHDQHCLQWERDGSDWPNREASRFVLAGGIRWHVQVMGQGPVLLLLHGTGAASHSWRELAPLLAEHYTVVAPDLPGHGFTQCPASRQLSLQGMATLLDALLLEVGMKPQWVVGHSAGAAIGAQMCLDGSVTPQWLVSLNGALLPLSGLPGQLFLPMAKFLANRPIWARLLANSAADSRAVHRLLDRTGSIIDKQGTEFYARLLRNTGHTRAALGMMANWDLQPLQRRLPELQTRVLLVVGENDKMVPPAQANQIRQRLPRAKVQRFSGYGHLLHEETPNETAASILSLDNACEAGQSA